MNKVLRKRLLRDLRANFGRYLALFLLFVMGLYLVVSIVGSSEMIIQGTENRKAENMVEDGQFSVFLPLSDDDISDLSADGTTIEALFSLDLKTDENATLRIFQNRNSIDLIQLDDGTLAVKNGEAVIEKGYADVHDIHIGDTVTADGTDFRIMGIGSVPDYDMCIAKFSDTAVERSTFGLLFVTAEQYDEIKESGMVNAEEYTYAYRLGNTTDDELKEKIKAIKIEPEQIENKYFREKVDDILQERHDIEDGIRDLKDGADELADGLHQLVKQQPFLQTAADSAGQLANGVTELQDNTDELLDEVFEINIENLTSFVKAEDNIRIAAAAGDVIMDKNAGLVAGIIVLALFAYVISVFVVHQIEQEQSVIGALYALGVKKKNLMLHYITMPTLVAFFAALLGTALGFLVGVKSQAQDSYAYFSLPVFDVIYPPYLVIYALILPPLISAVVNAVVINKKLSRTALSLMKNEQSAGSYRQFSLKTKRFPLLFAIRQLVRESRSAIAMMLGMFVSIMVVIMGLDCYVMCEAVQRDTVSDTKYEYQYLYKYPEKTPPQGGEAAYIETLSTDCMGYTLDVTVIGIDSNNKYFDAKPEKGKNKAVINSSLVERFGYQIGDRVIFSDFAADTDYSFTVTDISDYSVGFTIFMDIDSMRELFGQDEDYFNTIYSDKALDIDEGRLYSVTTKEDITRGSSVFVELMFPLVATLITAGSVIFCVVMYLMMGVMIDRAASGISLIKIFGYRPREIRALYLNGNLLIVAVGALLAVPLAKTVMDAIYPSFICNVACSMKLAFPWYLYAIIFTAVILVYFIINRLLIGKINRISPAEILKNRE